MVSALVEFAIIVLLKRKSVVTNNQVKPTILPAKKKQANGMLRHRFRKLQLMEDDTEISQHLGSNKDSNRTVYEDGISALLIKIDITAFLVFFLLFFLFNCIYWALVLGR